MKTIDDTHVTRAPFTRAAACLGGVAAGRLAVLEGSTR